MPFPRKSMRPSILGAAAAVALAATATAQPAAKPAPVAPQQFKFVPKTQVDGSILQVIFGERALFRTDDAGQPVLESVEKGQLAAAHPEGAAQETFAAPASGLLAAALDGSAEKQASVLKVWNRLPHAVEFKVIALVLHGQTLSPVVVPTCPIGPGGVHSEIWPAPVVAVGLSQFKPATREAVARCAMAKPGAKPPAKPAPARKGK